MLAAKRSVRHSKRRGVLVRPRRKVYVGSAVTRRAPSRFFLYRTTQQMTLRTLVGDWLGAAAMLAGFAGWGTLLMLLTD